MDLLDVIGILVTIWFQELGRMVFSGDILGIVVWLMGGGFVGFVLVVLARLPVRVMSTVTQAVMPQTGKPAKTIPH